MSTKAPPAAVRKNLKNLKNFKKFLAKFKKCKISKKTRVPSLLY